MTLSKTLFTTAALAALAGLTTAQYTASTIASNYVDISGSGTLELDTGDDAGVSIPLGFSFNLFGDSITAIGASSNGYLSTGTALTDFANDCIPTADEPNGLISPFWDDYSLDDHGDIYSQLDGSPGSQCLTIQWDDLGGFNNSGASFNFQVKMYEGSNDIEVQYGLIQGGTAADDGSTQTLGIENGAGDDGVEVSCDTAFDLTVGYLFEPPSVLPAAHTAPGAACLGGTVELSGSGNPGHFYGLAVSSSQGPTAGFDLGPDLFNNIISTGIIGATGAVGPFTVPVPATLPNGFTGYSQMITIGGFNPISDVSFSVSTPTTFVTCQDFSGTLDTDNQTSDLYELAGTVGETWTIALCRVGDQPDGSSLLDPRLCIYDSTTPTPGSGAGIAGDDDGGDDCFTTGPFGASLLEDWAVPADDTYVIAASGWDGTEGPYVLSIQGANGTATAIGDEVAGGCFN